MDIRTRNRVYEDFEPPMEWVSETGLDTLIIYLTDFKKENLRVQVTATHKLKVLGERPLGDSKWRRFRKEMNLPPNVDPNTISAKFENSILYIKHPKVIIPAVPTEPAAAPPKPAADQAPKPQQQAAAPVKVPPKANADVTQTNNAQANVTQMTPKKEEPSNSAGKSSAAAAESSISGRKTSEKEKEKELSDTNTKKTSTTTAADAKNVAQQTSEQQTDKAAGKVTTTSSRTDQKPVETRSDSSVKDAGKPEKVASANVKAGKGESSLERNKQVAGGLVMELKKPKNLVNLFVAFLLILVLGLYVKSVIKSLGISESDEL